MNLEYKKILYIDLNGLDYEFKVHEDLWIYIGGVGVSYRLLADNLDSSPIIITTGPLSGIFPYISKTNLLYMSNSRLIEKYGGGTMAGAMNMLGIDGIVLSGKFDRYLHIAIYEQEVSFIVEERDEFAEKESDFLLTNKEANSDGYFSFGDILECPSCINGGVRISIEATKSIDLTNFYDYEQIYNIFLDRYRDLSVEPRNNPSCFGCPMGCDKSNLGEDNINVAILPRCLIACAYAEDIYKNIPNVYTALTSVGYKYHHSHLEKLPELVGKLKTSIRESLNQKEGT